MSDTATTAPAAGDGEAAPQLSAAALEALEHQYAAVLRELQAEPQLEPLRVEYERIHRLLGKSHEGERRLLEKVRELQGELGAHAGKIDAAMGLSREDEETIANLRREIERAWALADAAHAREKESKEMTEALKKQVHELDKLVERSAGLSVGQEAYLKDLLETKKEREEENALLSARVARLGAEHKDVSERFRRAREAEAAGKARLDAAMADYNALLQALEAAQRDRAAAEERVRQYRTGTEEAVVRTDRARVEVEQLTAEEAEAKAALAAAADAAAQLERQVEDKKAAFKLEAEKLGKIDAQNKKLKKQLPALAATLAEKEAELARTRKALAEEDAAARAQQETLAGLVRDRDALLQLSDEHNGRLAASVAALNEHQRALRAKEDDLRGAMKVKDRALAENTSKENARGRAETTRGEEVGKRKRLEQELDLLLTENEGLRRQVFLLEQSSQREVGAAQEVMLAYHGTLDGIRGRRADARHLREVQALQTKKLKVQQELVERVRGDRNATEKQLKEAEKEWRQLQLQHTGKRDDIEGLKSNLIRREAELCQLHAVNAKLLSDTASTEQRALHLREDCANADKRIRLLEEERAQLEHIIASCDAEKQREGMKLTAIVNERNVLAAQLLQRDEEISALLAKIQLRQANLDRGGVEYGRQTHAIEALRDKLQETRLRCRLALVRVHKLEDLKKRELAAARELRREQAKARALTDEVQGTANVHRWRQLESTDPELMDGIAKVQLLQRKLVARQDECTRKLQYIERKEAEYAALRRQLARMPGPEAAEDLALYSENLSKRREQMQEMDGELREAERHAEVLADDVRRLTEELAGVKGKYYAAKVKHDSLAREQRAIRQTWGNAVFAQTAMQARSGTLGGGGTAATTAAAPGLSSSARSAPPGGSTSNNNSNNNNNSNKARSARKEMAKREEALMNVLTSGQPAPNFPLQKPKNQKLFVGGGFALNH